MIHKHISKIFYLFVLKENESLSTENLKKVSFEIQIKNKIWYTEKFEFRLFIKCKNTMPIYITGNDKMEEASNMFLGDRI